MSVIIKSLTHYLDGETIGIDCWISYRGEIIEGNSPTITIDCSSQSGEWYFGKKDSGGKPIEDKEFKEFVIKGIEEYLQNYNSFLHKIKSTLEKK